MNRSEFHVMATRARVGDNGHGDRMRFVLQRGEIHHSARIDPKSSQERGALIADFAAKLGLQLHDLMFLDARIDEEIHRILNEIEEQDRREVYGEDAMAANSVTYRAVEVGTIVKATDREPHNFGQVRADNGSSCTVFFQNGEHTATKEIDKEHLFLQSDGTPLASGGDDFPPILTFRELSALHPKLRPQVIHGLQRRGEIANVVSVSKTGKSMLAGDLSLSVTTGRPWFDLYPVEQGRVLACDNELHGGTLRHRIATLGDARGIPYDDYADHLDTCSFRGRLQDIFSLEPFIRRIPKGRYLLLIIDAMYRFLGDLDENSNGDMAKLYNQLDLYASLLDCAIVLIHHATKGNQTGKSITDVGAGAGSQSRAADSHFILRPHEEPDAVVFEGVCRSFPPPEPLVLRWSWPLWIVAADMDPTRLRTEKPTAAARLETVKDEILRSLVHFTDGSSKRGIQGYTGRPSCWERALRELVDSGQVAECEIKNPTNGKLDTGYRRVYDDGDF